MVLKPFLAVSWLCGSLGPCEALCNDSRTKMLCLVLSVFSPIIQPERYELHFAALWKFIIVSNHFVSTLASACFISSIFPSSLWAGSILHSLELVHLSAFNFSVAADWMVFTDTVMHRSELTQKKKNPHCVTALSKHDQGLNFVDKYNTYRWSQLIVKTLEIHRGVNCDQQTDLRYHNNIPFKML